MDVNLFIRAGAARNAMQGYRTSIATHPQSLRVDRFTHHRPDYFELTRRSRVLHDALASFSATGLVITQNNPDQMIPCGKDMLWPNMTVANKEAGIFGKCEIFCIGTCILQRVPVDHGDPHYI
jgi:hypothetical protein